MSKIITDKGNGIYEVTEVSDPVTIDTKELEKRIKDLEKQLQAEEPSKKELEEWGKSVHPFYNDNTQAQIQLKIDMLNDQINELKAVK